MNFDRQLHRRTGDLGWRNGDDMASKDGRFRDQRRLEIPVISLVCLVGAARFELCRSANSPRLFSFRFLTDFTEGAGF
jgi:hypothetical protein